MQQQRFEKALRDVRGVLSEADMYDTPQSAIEVAIAIITRVLQRPVVYDATEEERGASIARDKANNYSGY